MLGLMKGQIMKIEVYDLVQIPKVVSETTELMDEVFRHIL